MDPLQAAVVVQAQMVAVVHSSVEGLRRNRYQENCYSPPLHCTLHIELELDGVPFAVVEQELQLSRALDEQQVEDLPLVLWPLRPGLLQVR